MNYWLVKTEPSTWSWQDQITADGQITRWEGVRNAQALANLRAMKRGDHVLFYHTGGEKQVVGIVEVVREFYPDPVDQAGRAGIVDFKAIRALPKPVTLAQIKDDARLKNIALVKQSRLSVMPIDAASWSIICKLAGL